MKKNYLKSFGLFLLGGILSIVFSSLLGAPTSSYPEDIQKNNGIYEKTEDHEVRLDIAQQDIAAYQIWLKYLPRFVSIGQQPSGTACGRRLEYHANYITEEDWDILKGYVDAFIKENPEYRYSRFPFINRLNKSYYIDTTSINKALDSDTKATGINVYVGMRGLKSLKMDSLETHLYVVPTRQANDTTLVDQIINYEGNRYVFDLTHPCLNLCDRVPESRGGLFEPTLKPYSENK